MTKLPFTLDSNATLSRNATQAMRRAQARKGYVTAKPANRFVAALAGLLRAIGF